jgi:glucose/arabinose dehydrogenase
VRRVFIPAAIITVAVLAAIATSRGDGKEERSAYRFAVAVRNVDEPTHVTAPRNEPNNLYIVEKGGRIRVRVRGRLRARPFLNISRSVSTGSEQGLLSMAFHPNYARNRRFYINYTDTSGDTRVVEYRTRGLTVLTRTRRQLLFVNQPYSNHNGGQLAFGPDGWLYVGMGDGGSGGDPENRAQNMRQLLGKMLRINVNSRRPVVQITALGLRNPWRFSFDRQTGDLYIGDVGQNAWEEVNFTARSSTGRENYGWRVFEGRARFTNETPNPAGRLVMPIAVLPNPPHCSVIGGFVYRGRAVPAARGRYFLGDNCDSRIRTLPAPGGTQMRTEPFRINGLSSFGEDARGELYAASLNGVVYRLVS